MPRNVLIITYLFPPSGGIGPPRYVAYTRYLPNYGHRVHVLTARNPNTPLYDPALLDQVPPATKIYRVFNPDVPYAFRDRMWKRITGGGGAGSGATSEKAAGPGNLLSGAVKAMAKSVIQRVFNPDVQCYWVPFVLRAARRIIRERKIDTVILNTPPFSLHAVIPKLKQEFPHLTWITEVRDDWLGYYLPHFDSARNEAKQRLAVKLEGAGMRASDYVVAVTPAQRDAIRRRYADQPEGKFLFVPNGFDADLYEGFQPQREARTGMLITYFGSLYATLPYNPTAFLEAVDALPDEVREQTEVRFIGRIAKEAEPLLSHRRVKIRKLGFFPRAEGVKQLQNSDYLLLIANEATTHAGKLFDYLGAGIPILGLTTPQGEIQRILEETRAGVAVDGSDPTAIRALLEQAWARLQGRPHCFPEPDREAAMAYERKRLVDRLVHLTGLG